MAKYLKVAELNENGMAKVKMLEKALGTHIMAYRPGLEIADLSDEQVQEIQAAEEELGVILLAYSE